jgi:hypothetical protein
VRPHVGELRALAAAASGVPESDGMLLLTGDPIAEAARVTRSAARSRESSPWR